MASAKFFQTLLCCYVLSTYCKHAGDICAIMILALGLEIAKRFFFLFKKILYEPNPAEFESKFLLLMKHESVSSNKKVSTYFLNFYDRKAFWALHFHKNLILRGQNTNNICEAGIRVLKERILNRTKAYFAMQLFD